MSTRSQLHRRFIQAFADAAHPRPPVPEEELVRLAGFLATPLPASYHDFLRHHGPAYCPGILRLTVDQALEQPDLREILGPSQVREKCRELWTQGLPVGLYAFAVDCMGNAFCFSQSRQAQDDAPVIFFSRRKGEWLHLGTTFDALLQWYLNVLPVPAGAVAPATRGADQNPSAGPDAGDAQTSDAPAPV